MSDYLIDFEYTLDGDKIEADAVFLSDAEDIDEVENEALAWLKETHTDAADIKIVAIQDLEADVEMANIGRVPL